MNKRKKKKQAKKRELFICSFANSYREVRKLDRKYHEYVIQSKRSQRYKEKQGIIDKFEF